MTDNHNGETCEGCLYLSRSSWVCNAITDGVQSVKPWRTECVCEPSEFIPSLQYRQVLALVTLAKIQEWRYVEDGWGNVNIDGES